jgi:hypothetical protein
MGTFAETAYASYRLLFADQGKKLPFPFAETNGSCRFSV